MVALKILIEIVRSDLFEKYRSETFEIESAVEDSEGLDDVLVASLILVVALYCFDEHVNLLVLWIGKNFELLSIKFEWMSVL